MNSGSNLLTYILGVSLFVTSLSSLILGYLWLDMSISYSYLEDGNNGDSYSLIVAKSLLKDEFVGLREDELIAKLNSTIETLDEQTVLKKIKII